MQLAGILYSTSWILLFVSGERRRTLVFAWAGRTGSGPRTFSVAAHGRRDRSGCARTRDHRFDHSHPASRGRHPAWHKSPRNLTRPRSQLASCACLPGKRSTGFGRASPGASGNRQRSIFGVAFRSGMASSSGTPRRVSPPNGTPRDKPRN